LVQKHQEEKGCDRRQLNYNDDDDDDDNNNNNNNNGPV